MIEIENISKKEEIETRSRSRLYYILSFLYRFPDKQVIDLIRDGVFLDEIKNMSSNLPFEIPTINEDIFQGKGVD